MKRILIACLVLLLVSCESKNRKVYWYKQSTVDTTTGDDGDIYWYLIYNDGGSVSYCESSTPLNNFNSVTWSVSQGPPTGFQESTATQMGQADVELSEDQISSIDQQMNTMTEAETDANSDTDSSNSESSSSDSDSSGDSGGGDGGGDGGGGE